MTSKAESFLDETLVTELAIGTAAFRRALLKAGYETLGQAFRADEAEIDSRLSNKDADTLYDLLDAYEKDSEAFVARMILQLKTSNNNAIRSNTTIRNDGIPHTRKPHAIHGRSLRQIGNTRNSYALPDNELGRTLRGFEARVRDSFDRLRDRDNDYLAFEAFDDFSIELDEIRAAIDELFRRYGRKAAYLEEMIEASIPNLFILAISDLARRLYDGENLWGHLFNELSIPDSNQQSRFKRLFVKCLERKGMPTYAKDEQDFYYLYTALLHGGLSEDSWEEMWKRAFLPLARKALRDPYGMGQSLDGMSVLRYMRSNDNTVVLKKSVTSILDRVPLETLEPLIEDALSVARRVVDKSDEAIAMISSSGLPPAALEALDYVRASESPSSGTRGSDKRSHRGHRTIPLQEGDLLLDLQRGMVSVTWKPQRLPEEYVGYSAEFYVDGIKMTSKEILRGVGTAILEKTEIEVSPQASYSIEIRFFRPIQKENKSSRVEVGTLVQSFDRVHAGCFEFLETVNGVYRLRSKRDQIRRTRNIAFIVKEGRKIVPGPGMALIEQRETTKTWKGRIIQLYRVDPGAAGEVVSAQDGTILSAWHESYRASIRRDGIIGHTLDGLDLFGVPLTHDRHNDTLPEIHIKGANGQANYEDVAVVCHCDGRQVDTPLIPLYRDDSARFPLVGLAIQLNKQKGFPAFAAECVFEARQRSTGRLICRYRFAVVPIRDFSLSYIDGPSLTAIYTVRPSLDVIIRHDGKADKVGTGSKYCFKEPLSCNSTTMAISTKYKSMPVEFSLGLAGVEVEVADSLQTITRSRPLNAADASECSFDDEIVVRMRKNRSNRYVNLTCGTRRLLYGEALDKSEHIFNIFADPSVFAPGIGGETGTIMLALGVSFGMRQPSEFDSARTASEVSLLGLDRGFGIGKAVLRYSAEGRPVIAFASPATAPMRIEFHIDMARDEGYRTGETKRRAGVYNIEAGTLEMPARRSVELSVLKRDRVTIKVFPVDEFGCPDSDFAVELPVQKE